MALCPLRLHQSVYPGTERALTETSQETLPIHTLLQNLCCISMHGALQQKTRVQLSYARGERRSYDNCFHVITALCSEIVTWLSGLLWVLALHQLLPCVVTYCFAAYKHPSKHNARVSLSVPTHEWWHTPLSHTESHTAGKPWEALEEGDLHLPHQATMWFCLIWLELLSRCLNKGCLKDQARIKRKARGCFLFFWSCEIKTGVFTDSAFEVVTSECKHASHCAPVLAETTAFRG